MVGHGHTGPAFARRVRVVEADPPEFFFGRMAAHAHVLSEIHEHILDASLGGEIHHAVHGVFFADAAEVERHAALWEKNSAGAALDFIPADEFARGADGVGIRPDGRRLFPVP